MSGWGRGSLQGAGGGQTVERGYCLFSEVPPTPQHPIPSLAPSAEGWGSRAKPLWEPCVSGMGGSLGLRLSRWGGSASGHEAPVSCSGVATGIYTTSSPEACQYIIHDCRANIIVLDSQEQLAKILQVWARARGVGVKAGVS